jgi:hypothetical protein
VQIQGEVLLLQAKVLVADANGAARHVEACAQIRSALRCFEAAEDVARQAESLYLLSRLHARAGAIAERDAAAAAWMKLRRRAAVAQRCSVLLPSSSDIAMRFS